MCGIIGYVGSKEAGPILVEGLRRLEYRGYDSAGLSVISPEGRLLTVKEAGKLAQLERVLEEGMPPGTCGIAHTRWATHGAPDRGNAHPHWSHGRDIALVHNGIFENANVLRSKLTDLGYTFETETDTEAVVHLIDEAFKENSALEDAVLAALEQVEGAYGIAVVSSRDPGKIVVARKGSPLLIGIGKDGENLVGSDASAVIQHTKDVVYLDDGDCAVLTSEGYRVFHTEQGDVQRSVHQIEWDLEAAEKGGYEHFMLKEICEQPESIRNVMRGRLLEETGDARLGGVTLSDEELAGIRRIVITACGTSWHAALIGEYMLEELAGIPVEVEYASEFRYRSPVLEDGTLVLAISQSGETADTLAALEEARARGASTMGIVNVVGSSIARKTDFGIYLHAGPEIGVASTKAFTSQIVALALFTLYLGRRRHLSILQGRELVAGVTGVTGSGGADARAGASYKGTRGGVWRRSKFPLFRPRVPVPGGARGGAQAQGSELHPRRGIPGGRNETRPDRSHRREHAGCRARSTRFCVCKDRFQHRGSESAERPYPGRRER